MTSRGASFTSALVAETAARNIPLIICDTKFKPVSVAMPVVNHSDQKRRFEFQARAKSGLKNKIWKLLITAKVKNQAKLLGQYNANGKERLIRLASKIRPGDPKTLKRKQLKSIGQISLVRTLGEIEMQLE